MTIDTHTNLRTIVQSLKRPAVHLSPFHAWLLLVMLFGLVNLIQVLLLGKLFFVSAYGESEPVEVISPPAQTLSREGLDRIIADFEERQREFESLKDSYTAPADPSR